MADDLRLNVVTTADSKGLDQAAKDIKDTKTEADKLGKAFDSAGDNAETLAQDVGGATKSIKDHGEQVRRLREEYETTTQRIGELDAQFVAGGDRGQIKKDLREQRTLLADIRRAARELKVDLGSEAPTSGVMQDLFGGLPRLGGASPALVAGAAAIGVSLAPPIAAAVSGAILGGVGIGGVIGGAVLAANDPEVRAAWKRLGDDLMHELEPAGKAFAGPVQEAAGILRDAFEKSKIAESLAGAAGLVDSLARAVGGFVEKLGPGFGKALQGAKPVFAMLEKRLPDFGKDLSKSLSTVAAVAPSAARGLGQVVVVTGELTKQAAAAGAGLTLLNNLFPTTIGLMRLVPIGGFVQVLGTAAEQVAPKVASLGQKMGEATEFTGPFAAEMERLAGSTNTAAAALKGYDDQLAARASGQIAFEQSLDDLAAGFKEFGRNINIDTQNGRENMKNFEDAIGDAKKVRDDLLAQGKIEEANAAYKRMVDRIREVMTQAKLSKAEIDKLLGPHTMVINVTYKERNRPSFIASNLSEPAQDVARRAAGGPVTAGTPYIVGDGGRPELFVPSQSGYIVPSVPSGGGSMWAAPIHYTPSGNVMWDHWFEQFRDQVQSRGGTLAVVGLKPVRAQV